MRTARKKPARLPADLRRDPRESFSEEQIKGDIKVLAEEFYKITGVKIYYENIIVSLGTREELKEEDIDGKIVVLVSAEDQCELLKDFEDVKASKGDKKVSAARKLMATHARALSNILIPMAISQVSTKDAPNLYNQIGNALTSEITVPGNSEDETIQNLGIVSLLYRAYPKALSTLLAAHMIADSELAGPFKEKEAIKDVLATCKCTKEEILADLVVAAVESLNGAKIQLSPSEMALYAKQWCDVAINGFSSSMNALRVVTEGVVFMLKFRQNTLDIPIPIPIKVDGKLIVMINRLSGEQKAMVLEGVEDRLMDMEGAFLAIAIGRLGNPTEVLKNPLTLIKQQQKKTPEPRHEGKNDGMYA